MKTQWFLIFAAYISLGVQAFLDIGRGPLFPEIIGDLGLTAKQGGYHFSATSLAMLFGSFGASYLLKKASNFRILLLFLMVLVFGQYLLWSVDSLQSLILAGSVLGLGLGGMGVCQNLAISEAARGELQRKLYGGLHSMYALAALLAPVLLSSSLSRGVSWRDLAFYELLALAALFVSFFVYMLLSRKSKVISEVANTDQNQAFTGAELSFGKKALSAMGLAMYVVGELVVSIWLVLFLQKEKNYSISDSGDALSLFFILLLSGRVLMSFVDLKMSSLRVLKISFLSSGLLLVLGIAFEPLLISLSGLTMSLCFPVYMSYMAENLGNRLVQVMPYCIGGMSFIVSIAHSLAGYLGENLGLFAAMSLSAVGAFGAFVFLMLIEASFKQDRQPS